MAHWFKRSLLGLAGIALVAGSLSGCAGARHGWGGGWSGSASESDRAAFRERMVDRVSSHLQLDDAQRQKLVALAEAMRVQREAMRAGGDPREGFRSLFAGARLDRARAQQMLDEKTDAVRAGGPRVIAAAGDFFDSLNPTQQQQVREFMQRRGGHMGRRG